MDSGETKLKSNKKWKRRKFLRCFRPVNTDGFVRPKINGSDGDDEYFKCVTVGRKESAVFPAQMTLTASTCVSSDEDENEEEDGAPRLEKIGASRRISRAFKAVLRDASMAKNIGKRRLVPQKSSNALIGESSRHREMEISDARRFRRVASSVSTSSYSSQASSLMTTNINNNNNNARITTERIRSFGSNSFVWKRNNMNSDDNVEEDEAHKKNKLCYASNTGMCLVVLSLLVLITWGKIFAIFLTSTWLFFMPFWAKKDDQMPVAKPSEMDSAEYKKRVVMEGFLARNRIGSFNGRLL